MFNTLSRHIAAVALSAGMLAFAGVTRTATAADVDSMDKAFIQKAAVGGMMEVQTGQVAQQKAAADDVKQFGAKMVEDHGKANEELKTLAKAKNVDVPTELMGEHKEHYDRLSKLSGTDFDNAYIRHMIKDHQEDIADFQKEANDGKDADVKAWASKTLPVLQEHLKMIQQVAQAHGVEARTAGEKQPAERPSNQGNPGVDAGKKDPTNPK